MDFDYDLKEGHMTIANSFDSQLDALIALKVLIILSYLSLVVLCIFDILDWQVFFVYLTIPLAVDLYKSMVDFSTNPESIPEKKWYHFPMENMRQITKMRAKNFMIRIYQSRNLMIYFGLALVVAIILENI
jgi:1,4-dihydroxy-2-naphthoate octaprenyltransferase